MTGPETSRRELIRGAALAAAAAGGALPLLVRARPAFAQAEGDAALLEAAVAMEQEAVLAYTRIAEGGTLGLSSELARLFAKQDGEHADGLITALRNLGAGPPPRPADPREVPGLADALSGDSVAITRFALELQAGKVAAYHAALGQLERPSLVSTVTSVMANEAQRLVVLRQALGRNPAPRAFVTGRVE